MDQVATKNGVEAATEKLQFSSLIAFCIFQFIYITSIDIHHAEGKLSGI